MKISNSKKELARIISENGGWQEHCEWAVQDKSGEFGESSVILFDGKDKPIIEAGMSEWMCAQGYESDSTFGKHVCDADKLVKNWHQTILSRAEYFHLYPAPDADGWIEWKGGECPVEVGTIVDVKQRDGDFGTYLHAGKKTFELQSEGGATAEDWSHLDEGGDIIAYRLHKPEQERDSADQVEVTLHGDSTLTIGGDPMTAMRRMQDSLVFDTKPSIEQLASDYRNAKDYAERKQREADDAKSDADAKLAELIASGKELGLVIDVRH